MPDTDPFTQLANAYWTVLEADAAFAAAVETNNRIKFSGGIYHPDTAKEMVQYADFPQVTVLSLGSDPFQRRTSNSSNSDQLFSIETRTGPFKLEDKLSLDWIIYRALMNAHTTFIALTWGGSSFAKHFLLARDRAVVQRRKQERDVNPSTGWVTSLACVNQCWFGTTAITP